MRPTYWWKTAKIYELYVDKFAKNFRGLIDHMDHFSKLGINTLHILPHYPSPMIDQGYDITDHRGVRSDLGTIDDLREAIEAAHERGIRIIIDLIINHVSVDHPWFREARASLHNPKRDFFIWSKAGKELKDCMNVFPDVKPSNWIYNAETRDYYYASFYAEQPDLNWDNPELLKEMLAIMDHHIALGVDGFRLDAAAHLIKREGTLCKGLPEVHRVIKEMRRHLDAAHPDVILLAEASLNLDDIKAYFGDGDECHMAYNFPLMLAMWRTLLYDEPEHVAHALEQSKGIPEHCQWATFLRNHDEIETRLPGVSLEERMKIAELVDPKEHYRFNEGRSVAVRLATAFGGDEDRIVKALKLLYSLPGAPVMYSGDEIGMENTPPQDGVLDTRIYVRSTFDWERAKRQTDDPNSLFNQVSAIMKSRESTPVLPVSVPAPRL